MNNNKNNGGFIQIIVIIVLIIIVISLLGISLKEVFDKLSANPEVAENFSFVKNWIIDVYNQYLSEPVKRLFIFIKDSIFNAAKEQVGQ